MSVTMTKPEPALRDPDLRGLRLLVVGMGISGMAAARLAAKHGATVTLTDRRAEAELTDALAGARAIGAAARVGAQPPELAAESDLVVVSPGVAPEIELLVEARRRGLPIWGEVELAARFCRGRVIGVTGSNGKSTVTTMIGSILRSAGFAGGVGGNLATPFADLLVDDSPAAIHTVELSSFQLENVEALRPEVSVFLNLSPDHLDRYPSYEAYGRAKARLLEVQSASGAAVLNADDPDSRRFDEAVRGRLYEFSVRGPVARGAFLRDGRLVLRDEQGELEILDGAALPQPGMHNVANALAAAIAGRCVGCDPAAIANGLRDYTPLPHRLEKVRTLGGVTFYDDSKATNPASAAQALTSFDLAAVHLILGGKDKDADWNLIDGPIRHHAKRVLLVGQAAPMLARRLAGKVPLQVCETIARAVQAGFRDALPGEVVLLSPGCASFDQYASFEERGRDFRRAVEALELPGDRSA